MVISIACDHGAFDLKERLKAHLLEQGHQVADCGTNSTDSCDYPDFAQAAIEKFGPDALGDRRRGNGAPARLVTPELLDRLRTRLETPPPDGGVWTTIKVAAWMAQDLGLVSVYPQRAWDALQAIGWSIQAPRPRNPAAASPEDQAAFKKNSPPPSLRKRRATPAAQSRSSARTSTASG